MKNFVLWIPMSICLILTRILVSESSIPTTLEGPFKPETRRFDPSLRRGSDDLPMNHPRLKKNVTSNFPEQISLAISSPTSMWVSWVTGTCLFSNSQNLLFLSFLVWFARICELGLILYWSRGRTSWFKCEAT